MVEVARFFDAASYTEGAFAQVLSRLATTGVIAGRANNLAPTFAGSNVSVNTGEAFVEGFWYQNQNSKAIAVPANLTGTARIDAVVLHLNRSANTLIAELHTGVVGAGAPALTQVDGGDWEYQLASLSTTSGVTTLTDTRTYSNNSLTAVGDIIVGGVGGVQQRLGKGANNSIFGVDNTGAIGYMTSPRVTGLGVNKAAGTSGQILAAARIDSDIGIGHKHLAGAVMANGGTLTFNSILPGGTGTSLISIQSQAGDFSSTQFWILARNASSGTFCAITQFGATLAAAAGGATFTVAVTNQTLGTITITNAYAGSCVVNVTELPFGVGNQ